MKKRPWEEIIRPRAVMPRVYKMCIITALPQYSHGWGCAGRIVPGSGQNRIDYLRTSNPVWRKTALQQKMQIFTAS